MDIDREALEHLKLKFLERYSDFPALTFAASEGDYWDEERSYKQILIDGAQNALTTEPPLSDEELGGRLLGILTGKPSNLLNWRTQSRLKQLAQKHPRVIDRASGQLARSTEPPVAAVARFVKDVWPLFVPGNEKNLPFGDIRAIPTMVLSLVKPRGALAIRYQPIHTAGVALLHRSIFANGPLSASEYESVFDMAQQIFGIMRDNWHWAPRDLWDVQGFIWVTCRNKSAVDMAMKDDEEETDMPGSNSPPSTNLILYGPAGTGKTYAAVAEAVRLCDGDLPPGGRAEHMKRYRELLSRKRIEFVTFHQSFSYEDFIEGLRPETGTAEDSAGDSPVGFRLVPRPGIFQAIADRAAANRGAAVTSTAHFEDRQAFKMSLGRSGSDEEAYLFTECIKSGYVLLGYGGEVDWSDRAFESFDEIKSRWRQIDPNASGNDPNIQQIYALRSWMKVGDLVIVSDGNKRFRAIGEVSGPYRYVEREQDGFHHQREVRWLWVQPDGLPREEIYNRQFSQVSIYRLDSGQVKWPALDELMSAGGLPEQYVLVIDEINRANVKVFGELITLIERDKRLGAENELRVTLPYSGKTFGVPGNLHMVGTMNTADRSIALLDTALRRRFRFKELMPNAELLKEDIDGIDVRAVLSGLNSRIEYLFDRDHQVGHAYFMQCTTRADLERVMRDEILPLLAEYFYEDWEKIRAVLNERQNDGAFISRTLIAAPQTSSDTQDFENELALFGQNDICAGRLRTARVMIVRSIREWEYLPIVHGEDNPESVSRAQADRLLAVAQLASRRLKIGGTEGDAILVDGHKRLRAKQVVGLLVAPGVTLEILPKINGNDAGRTRENLVRMLARTLDLRVADGELTRLRSQRYNLLEILIRLFCDRLFEVVHRGLPRRYVSREEDLPMLRGRLDLIRQYTMLAVAPQKLACQFEELSPDIALNRIMKAAVRRLRRIARAQENQRRLIELEFAFADVTELPPDRIPWDQVIIDRTNSAWANLLELAKLLLGDRFQTTTSGTYKGFSLLFEMNTLFEEFIGRILQAAMRREGSRVTLQGPKRYTLTDANGTGRFMTIPDVVIHAAGSHDWIIDTKWKRLTGSIENPKQGVAQADVYQMLAYAIVYGSRKLMLLYPHHDGLGQKAGLIADLAIRGTEIRLVIASVDLSHIPSVPAQLAKLLLGLDGLG